jgi:cyclohexanecarboxylate-CoA ligase
VPSVWRGFDYESMAGEIAGELAGLRVLVADRQLPAGDPTLLPPPPPPAGADAPVRWLFSTSGTTADPKVARHTDATMLAFSHNTAVRLRLRPDDRVAMVFPFTHIGGIGNMLSIVAAGASGLWVEAFDPPRTIPFLAEHGVTQGAAGTPFWMAYLAAQRSLPPGRLLFPDLRALPGGGAPKPPSLVHDVMAEMGVPVCSGWGLTEAPILTMNDPHSPLEVLAETEGAPLDGVEIRVVRLDGSLAAPGEEGELRAKAPQIMIGYLDASLDADAFDDDGWFRTGDLGRCDRAGHVTLTGRLKDIIIRKGENVSAKEVEDLLHQHPAVADCAVVGLPDPGSGERVCAVVVTAAGHEPLTLAAMREHLDGRGLRRQAVPEQLEHVEALPRNPSGKILKYQLRERFSAV